MEESSPTLITLIGHTTWFPMSMNFFVNLDYQTNNENPFDFNVVITSNFEHDHY